MPDQRLLGDKPRRQRDDLTASYQALLTSNTQSATETGALTFKFGVGAAVDCYFDW